MQIVTPALVRLVMFLMLGVLLPAPASAQKKDKKQEGDVEDFEELDPYTEGLKERMDALGYVTYGPFPWHGNERTVDVQQNVGGIPMLWVETAHFRIGSSLATYELPNDREERARIRAELARLKEKLGKKFKPPRKELDPWLRVHLYAQRMEDLYASFTEDFGLDLSHFGKRGEHLGNPNKFLVLFFQKESEYGRYLRTYLDTDFKRAYRWGWQDDCMFAAANMEAIVKSWTEPEEEPFDAMLHCQVVALVAANFVDGFDAFYGAPTWLGFAMGHVYVRRIDPEWITSAGHSEKKNRRDDDWKWEGRLKNMVKNDFFAKTEDMFAWQKYEDMHERDHMVAWSKLEYLMKVAEGDARGFLMAVCKAPKNAAPEGDATEMVKRQTDALQQYFNLSPSALDEAWAEWVKKTYKKK